MELESDATTKIKSKMCAKKDTDVFAVKQPNGSKGSVILSLNGGT